MDVPRLLGRRGEVARKGLRVWDDAGMDLLMFAIAGATLGILLWQEWRRHRERPRPQIDVETLGWMTDRDDNRWEFVQVTNSGNEAAVIDNVMYMGLKVLSNGEPDGTLSFNLPRVLKPGVHIKLAIQGEDRAFDQGWLRLMWHIHGSATLYLQWAPVDQNSDLAELKNRQWERMYNRGLALKRPKFWTRTFWRETLPWKPAPVSPNENGYPLLRVTPRRRKRHKDLIAIAVGDDNEAQTVVHDQ